MSVLHPEDERRVTKAKEAVQAAISWKKQVEAEVDRARFRRLQEEAEVAQVATPPDFGAEIAELRTKLPVVEEEPDALHSTA